MLGAWHALTLCGVVCCAVLCCHHTVCLGVPGVNPRLGTWPTSCNGTIVGLSCSASCTYGGTVTSECSRDGTWNTTWTGACAGVLLNSQATVGCIASGQHSTQHAFVTFSQTDTHCACNLVRPVACMCCCCCSWGPGVHCTGLYSQLGRFLGVSPVRWCLLRLHPTALQGASWAPVF